MPDPYIQLAYTILDHFFNKLALKLSDLKLPEVMMTNRAGVFVSLHKNGQLRGCIGTLAPTTKNIAEEIKQNAISAALADPRFPPLEPTELAQLKISVDVLSRPELITEKSQLNPKKYGVIVELGQKKGVLLPDLEEVDSIEQQLQIACTKADIDFAANNYKIYRFTVNRHE